LGLAGAKQKAQDLHEQAVDSLSGFGAEADLLRAMRPATSFTMCTRFRTKSTPFTWNKFHFTSPRTTYSFNSVILYSVWREQSKKLRICMSKRLIVYQVLVLKLIYYVIYLCILFSAIINRFDLAVIYVFYLKHTII
jgi:hypothetical protein